MDKDVRCVQCNGERLLRRSLPYGTLLIIPVIVKCDLCKGVGRVSLSRTFAYVHMVLENNSLPERYSACLKKGE